MPDNSFGSLLEALMQEEISHDANNMR